VTVSLATAILPRLAARANVDDDEGIARSLSDTLRTALAVVIPFALLLPVIALDLSHVIWGFGAAADTFDLYAPSLALFGGGLVFFTVHYLVLRGFYALELNRTVFWIQCAVAATNIAMAVALVQATAAVRTSPALVGGYTASYVVGAALSYAVLARALGGLETARLLRFLARLLIAAAVSTLVAGLVALGLDRVDGDPGWPLAAAVALVVVAVDVVAFLVMARVLRLREVTEVVDIVLRRLPLPRRR